MTSWEFPGADPIDLFVNIPSGSVAVSGEATDVTTVELVTSRPSRDAEKLISEVQVSFTNGRLEIVQPKMSGFLRISNSGLDVTVKVPAGSRGTLRTASADVSCVGELAELDARTASGDVTVALVTGRMEVTTASGDVFVEKAGAGISVNTASGDIQLREAAGEVTVTTASGDVNIGQPAGSVHASSASGDIQIRTAVRGEIALKTVSGDSVVGVAAGTDVYLDLSSLTGRLSSQLQDSDGGTGADLQLRCRSVSGDIKIVRAEPASAA
jgi:DUF4097 and DUF4098 domain-containing protein YvlB